jgi:hypothetical protein
MAFGLDLTCWGYCSVMRTLRYSIKGFRVFMPWLHRDAFKKGTSKLPHTDDPGTLSLLFWAEAMLMGQIEYPPPVPDAPPAQIRLTAKDLLRVRPLRDTSDYASVAKLRGYSSLVWIIRNLVRRGMRWLRESLSPAQAHWQHPHPTDPETPYEWHVCDPNDMCMAMFNPTNPRVSDVFDMPLLAKKLAL